VDDPEQWRWIWLGTTVLFLLGEMFSPGSFFLLPFAIGAGVAAILAFADVGLLGEWLAFVGVSIAFFAGLRPLAKRLDSDAPVQGIGAKRLIGEIGSVIEPIGGDGDLGLVRIHREQWRAETVDDSPLENGTRVRVVEVKGTRVVVWPVDVPEPPALEPNQNP
jgi:membrane protein implicated in regulation of membrane protease activity